MRCITAISLLEPVNNDSALNIVACAFSDGTLTLWKQNEDDTWTEDIVMGITDPSLTSDDANAFSITDVGGLYSVVDGIIYCMLVTSNSQGVDSFLHTFGTLNSTEPTRIGNYASCSVKMCIFENTILLAVGTAMPRNNRIHFYTNNEMRTLGGGWKHQGSVIGHLDWVTCMDWIPWKGGSLMLASGSKDARIRLWKFHSAVACEDQVDDGSDEEEKEAEDDEDDNEDLLEDGEARLYIYLEHDSGKKQISVSLEALLIGHEEPVTSVAWRPKASVPSVVSSSMDRSILIWMEETDTIDDGIEASKISNEGNNVWVPESRVGAAGGILGGSIGSSLLGFVNVMWSSEGNMIVGHGYGGSLHFWSVDKKMETNEGNTDLSPNNEQWHADPCITGHFRGCSDISWEPTEGIYLLSAGLDQTTRMWVSLPNCCSVPGTTRQIWREIGRPQVHGYDLTTVACIGDGKHELKYRFVSGADEKEARAFDAPLSTLRLFKALGTHLGETDEGRVERAYIPSLGLSNRATAKDTLEEGGDAALNATTLAESDTFKSLDCKPTVRNVLSALPKERDLGVISLWPEIRKLYGHQTEMICLASTAGRCESGDGPVLVASSCKARDAINASIRIWNVERNMCIDELKNGHKSTVVSISFSADGKFLASTGKDRRLCIWQKRSSDEENMFNLAAVIESAHKRIVWSVDFSATDSSLLATGSRDGSVKLWRIKDDSGRIKLQEIHRFEPNCKGEKKVEAVTAVAFAPRMSQEGGSILAIGMECGLIELWGVSSLEERQQDEAFSCKLLKALPSSSCHCSTVKKIAWRPVSSNMQNDELGMGLTLATCGLDNGVRIFKLDLLQNR